MPECANCAHLNRDGARFCDACGAVLETWTNAGEQRKTVTVLFCDVSGSTALGERLDPESLRGVMARYFDFARMVVERHEGSVEKFIGDAVMAVFGIPVVHEDDALRALRAAGELRDGLVGLNEGLTRDYGTTLELRIGVNTGKVVTGTEERLATGDAVNIAARLEQAAEPGEILLGAETRALVGDAVEAESIEPLVLKGKAEAVDAYRLLTVRAEASPSRAFGAMVGRSRELARLEAALTQAVADQSCQLFTVLGAAGVGKSRLVHEFLAGLQEATVVRGGCLSYGEGISYWPVVEVVKQLLEGDADQGLQELGMDVPSIRPIQALLGDGSLAVSTDEIAWSIRRLFEAAARRRPLVVVLDDIHWGEGIFLDLVDHIADLSRDAPILLLCMARPELLDHRPNWGGGKLNATAVLLEPLAAGEAEALVANLFANAPVDESLRAKILDAAEGNPLFVQEMVALVRASPTDAVVVPPTIQALLAARLDQLEPAERVVLERGSIEGRTFHRGAVQALSPHDEPLLAPLTALVRRELLRPDRSQLAGEDAFRFRHLLIRDAAYDALPKATRAELHERFADWMDERASDLVELDEIVGYHLERAYQYRVELGPAGDVGMRLATRAARRLSVAATKAAARGDELAMINLCGRAISLYAPADADRLHLLPAYGRALHEGGQWELAEKILSEAVESARAAGDRRTGADAAVSLTHLRVFQASFDSHESIREELADAISVFEALGDEAGLARALGLAGQLRFWNGQSAAALDELERAAGHARNAGDRTQEAASLGYVLLATTLGPTPAPEALRKVEQVRDRVSGHRKLEVAVGRSVAYLRAMQGDFDGARSTIDNARSIAEEIGEVTSAGVLLEAGRIELLAGDVDTAVKVIRASLAILDRIGDRGHSVTVAGQLADALLLQGETAEAASNIDFVIRWSMDEDLDPQIARRRVQGRLLALEGRFDEAERLAREAVELADRTDYLVDRAATLDDLGEVLGLAGRTDEAAECLGRALELHEQKGNVAGAARTQARLGLLQATAP